MPQDSMNNTPQLFTQIPYFVKGKGLTSTDKMVFGTIYTMLNTSRICFMHNKKIAENVEISERSVSRSIAKLRDIGLIEVHLIYKKDSKEVDKRYINLPKRMFRDVSTPMTQMTPPPTTKRLGGIDIDGEGIRLSNRLKEEEEEGQLKIYKLAWDESENLSPITQKKLINLCKKHGQSLFNYAVEVAAESNVKFSNSYRYLSSILTDWSKNNVKDVTGAKNYVVGRKKKQSKPKKSNYGHKPFKEELPIWAKAKKDLTPEEKQQLADEKAKNKSKQPNTARKKELEDKLKRIRSFRKEADD